MSNNLTNPVEISPSTRDSNADGTPDSDVVGGAFGTVLGTDWVSQWFNVDGAPHASEELSVMCYVDWQGATSIEILPQFQHLFAAKPHDARGIVREEEALPIVEFDGGRLNASFQIEQDTITLLQSNFRTDPGASEQALAVSGVSRVRFLARAVGGAPVMRLQVLAGGGWRGA